MCFSCLFICCLSCVLGVLSCLDSRYTHEFSCWLLAKIRAALPLYVIYFAFRTQFQILFFLFYGFISTCVDPQLVVMDSRPLKQGVYHFCGTRASASSRKCVEKLYLTATYFFFIKSELSNFVFLISWLYFTHVWTQTFAMNSSPRDL